MNRKVLTLMFAGCLSAGLLTGCGVVDDDNGNVGTNNVNGFQQRQLDRGMNRGRADDGFDLLPGRDPIWDPDNGVGNYETGNGRDVGTNGVGVSGTSNAPRVNGGMNNR